MNPGSKLKTAVTGKVKKGSKAAKRRKSFCARSAGQMKKFPKAAKDPNSRLRQARKRLEMLKPITIGIILATIINIFFKQYDELSACCRYEHGQFYGSDG